MTTRKYTNGNPLVEEQEREEDFNTLRSHWTINYRERVLLHADFQEEPENFNPEDTGVCIDSNEYVDAERAYETGMALAIQTGEMSSDLEDMF